MPNLSNNTRRQPLAYYLFPAAMFGALVLTTAAALIHQHPSSGTRAPVIAANSSRSSIGLVNPRSYSVVNCHRSEPVDSREMRMPFALLAGASNSPSPRPAKSDMKDDALWAIDTAQRRGLLLNPKRD